ncbi:MAG: ATP-binding protein [Candidatus Verstraetearchaeota archaeon]|nr:ATP-binding protein [Candidatus Verstraetearchaeota archaeon]
MRRVKLSFAGGLEVEFTDRGRAIKQVEEFAERGTRYPVVVFGPEGCGKTAWLKQATELLRELGFEAIYVNPLHRDFVPYTDVKEVVQKFVEAVGGATGIAQLKLTTLTTLVVRELLTRWKRRRIAMLVDDVFQAIGLERVEMYVKELLGLIEYPPESYEKIVVIAATSEGVSRWRIGRHRWAEIMPMWNMSRRGFEELYEEIPGNKPKFEDAWLLTGGNPNMLSQLYQARWNPNIIIKSLIEERRLTLTFISKWRDWLKRVVEDPDALWSPDTPEELVNELEARNLIIYFLRDRDPEIWIDEPPPEKDLEIGVGKRVAWQTPLHREAVKRAITQC